MPQLRTDPLTGRSVIIAESRAGRPNEFGQRRSLPEPTSAAPRADCPFCVGNESLTPRVVHELCNPAGEWQVRVVPNKYPSCTPDAPPGELAGAHEVIVESRSHRQSTGQLDAEELAGLLGVYAARLDHWRTDGRFPFRLLFKNVGPSAGATLSHLHSQLIASENLSAQSALEATNVARHPRPEKAWEEWLEGELADGRRLVDQSEGFVLFCPQVGRAPLETWLMPRQRAPLFEESMADESRRRELAELLLPAIRRIEHRIAPLGYNLILHTSPAASEQLDRFYWRIEIVPRVASLAGFELGTGVYINTVLPEQAAAELRG